MATIQNNENKYGSINLTEQYIKKLELIKNNPGRVIETAYEVLELATDGKINVPNPSHPFGYLMEASAVTASHLHQAYETIYREQYPRLATEYRHLYNHMFDEQYLGRFALPGSTGIDIYLNYDDLLRNLTETDVPNVKKMILPRGSIINATDYAFTLLYPIEITQLAHGGLQVLYITDPKDPVHLLSSNIVEWDKVTVGGEINIRIRPIMKNIVIQTYTGTLTQSTGFNETYNFKNKFVHCRMYQLRNNRWEEIHVTHGDIVYDATKVTARATYLGNSLMMNIPQIYFNKELNGTQFKVEIYTTLGNVEENLQEFNTGTFSLQWNRLEDQLMDTRYSAKLEALKDVMIAARTPLSGGKDPESFEETRDRVVNFANYTETPITPNQLSTGLKVGGYNIIKSRDTLTSRGYLAVRSLPLNKYDTFNSGASSAMERVRVTLDSIAKHPHVRDNGKRMTITPDMLFRNTDGVVNVVFPEQIPTVERLGNEQYLGAINSLEYAFTPFYYVIDTSDESFDVRSYYFDDPKVDEVIFIANNSTSGLTVSTDKIVIQKYKEGNSEGFRVNVQTRSNNEYKNIPVEKLFCQLAIKPVMEESFAYINGRCLGQFETSPEQKNVIWTFDIKTNWDVTKDDALILKEFFMYINEPRKYPVPLNTELHFIYGVKDMVVPGYEKDEVDKLINREIIEEDNIIAITHDKVPCSFGDRLKNFWCNGITVQGSIEYARHEHDVPRTYSRDVYSYDENGLIELTDEGNLIIVHHKGDPVLDEKGQPVYLARRGDVKIDNNGLPIMKNDRQTQRILDILMVDGIYYFANDEQDSQYRKYLTKMLRNWIIEDLNDISKRLLENTNLYFYPKRTMGDATLIVDGGVEIQTAMRLSFKVTYYMLEGGYGNFEIRDAITQMTHNEINAILENQTVSTSDIVALLKEKAGDSVKAVEVNIVGPKNKITIFTSKDNSVRCSVKRVVKQQADKSLKVIEDIEVNYVKHDTVEELRR